MAHTMLNASQLNTQPANISDWKPLYLFNFYRITIALSFLILVGLGIAPDFIAKENQSLFLWVDRAYLLFGLISHILIKRRSPPFAWQIFAQFLFDIAAITLMMYASGGLNSGLGVLLIISIAGVSLLTEGLLTFFFAAVATISVLVQATFVVIYGMHISQGTTIQNSYIHASMLGVSFFATAFLGQMLAKRIHTSEALAKQRGLHLQYLAQLNAQIVQNIQSGIVVVDLGGRVRLFNEAARRLLGLHEPANGRTLSAVTPELAQQLEHWQQQKLAFSRMFRPTQGGVSIITTFTELDRGGESNVLIVLEDATVVNQQAAQLKLSSLARLTGSIAHEIRNPLSAISQAGQLLNEDIPPENQNYPLVQMILNNTKRVNTIIENVLQISRRGQPHVLSFDLHPWITEFIEELRMHQHLPASAIELNVQQAEIVVCFDKVQLFQVVNNLCENGLRYSKTEPMLALTVGVNQAVNLPFLDIKDFGKGMSHETAKQIFEPFFTTEDSGTGLGLYVARELCDANRAFLQLVENTEQGCCFRIHFSRAIVES
ncbi:MAG: hypothetical protein RIS84_1818 [Pseudomonadota bacterium]